MTSDSKRQSFPTGTLWAVATPIGNLEDLSPRARMILSKATRILCEDTRRTRTLMSALGIGGGATLERLDAHAEGRRIPELVEALRGGEVIALVSDAGTPAVSDPGARLIEAARSAGVRVLPAPGPSAVTALMSVGGFRETAFAFRGFFPRKSGERRSEIKAALADSRAGATIWFESPERIESVIEELALMPEAEDARLVVAKEMTKTHEDYLSGSAREVLENFGKRREADEGYPRGEWCIAIEAPVKSRESEALEQQDGEPWGIALRLLLDAGASPSDAARQVSKAFGVAKKLAYASALRFSGKK